MFQTTQQVPIGTRNLEQVTEQLTKLEIPIVDQDVEGHIGRTLEFHVAEGRVYIRKRGFIDGQGDGWVNQEMKSWNLVYPL